MPARKRKTAKKAAAKPRRKAKRGGPKILPPQLVTVYHPQTGEPLDVTLEIKPKITVPKGWTPEP